MAKNESSEFIITPEFRAAFAYVFEPQDAFNEGQQPSYTLVMLFPKDKPESIKPLQDLMKKVVFEKFPDPNKRPKGLDNPIKDGDDKAEWDGFPGHWYVRAKSKYQPGVVDAKTKPIINPADFYSGCYARAEVNAYYYDQKGNKGVSFGLSNVQKLRDGEPFGNRRKPEDVFSPVVSEGDDALYENDSASDDMFA